MKKMKSAYEIALERANRIDQKNGGLEQRLDMREELKPLVANFYKNKIDAEGLWQKLKGKEQEMLQEAQLMLIESVGLRTPEVSFKKTREGVLAVESLKDEQNSSAIEQVLSNLKKLQEQYNAGRKEMEQRLQEAAKNAEMRMRPVKGSGGRTMMKMERDLDEKTKKGFSQALAQLEESSTQTFESLLAELKEIV